MVSRPPATAMGARGSPTQAARGTARPALDPNRAPSQTEREGFEPSIRFYPYTRLAGVRLRPLGHLSRPPIGTRCSPTLEGERSQGTPPRPLPRGLCARTWSRQAAVRSDGPAGVMTRGLGVRPDRAAVEEVADILGVLRERGFGGIAVFCGSAHTTRLRFETRRARSARKPSFQNLAPSGAAFARFADRLRDSAQIASARRWPTHGHTAPHAGTRVA